MPRKTLRRALPMPLRLRFNEAAARCRGKPRRRDELLEDPVGASMRPRPDAAENSQSSASAADW